jgi:hypothetical protein
MEAIFTPESSTDYQRSIWRYIRERKISCTIGFSALKILGPREMPSPSCETRKITGSHIIATMILMSTIVWDVTYWNFTDVSEERNCAIIRDRKQTRRKSSCINDSILGVFSLFLLVRSGLPSHPPHSFLALLLLKYMRLKLHGGQAYDRSND